jgi:hypothetical protein
MSKFNAPSARTTYPPRGPSTTTGRTTTYEGGIAFTRDTMSELALLAVTNMVGEDTFYESAADRDARFNGLVRSVAVGSGAQALAFATWLRGEGNMRSASITAAAEGVLARLAHAASGPQALPELNPALGINRKLTDAVLQRADEPGELLGYFATHYGQQDERARNGIAPAPRIPMPVKRGVADAVRRLYTERTYLKWNSGASKGFQFADIIEMVHPKPRDARQAALFSYILDRRHGRDHKIPATLPLLRAHADLMHVPVADRREVLRRPDAAEVLNRAGMTWESLAGWLQGPMDAEAWSAIIPSMGAMALVRNLRNFDEAGVPDSVAALVAAKLADPEEIARSRQFPYRYLSAYRMAPSLRWGYPLEQALALACANIPLLPGRTLVLVDTSSSMRGQVSDKSQIRHVDVGALFGVALAARGAQVDLVGYANGTFVHPLARGGSVLKQAEDFTKRIGEVGHGTETAPALRTRFAEHDRVVVVTDGQAFYDWSGVSVTDSIPADVPMFGVNTTGYAQTSLDLSRRNRYEIGGFSDRLFTMVDLLSRGRDAKWPWEVE